MKKLLVALLAVASFAIPLQAAAQQATPEYDWFGSRVKFRGNHIFNSSTTSTTELPGAKNGFGAGMELVFGNGLGFGLFGYTPGSVSATDSTTQFTVVAEANYFVKIKALRLAPYAGVHGSLGTDSKAYFDAPTMPKFEDEAAGLGYQVGLRWQPFDIIGLDAQWRHISEAAFASQGTGFERNQVLLGMTLF